MKSTSFKKTTVATFSLMILFAFCLYALVNLGSYSAYASELNSEEIYYSDDIAYSNDSNESYSQDIFDYSSKTVVSEYIVNASYPQYYNTNLSLTNACANIAGANIVGFYARYHGNLIPDCVMGIINTNNIYTYYPIAHEKAKKQAVIDSLYGLMSTNNPNPGTTQAQYKSGLTSFVNGKGNSITFTSIMSSGSLNLSTMDTQLRAGRPISLFLSSYNVSVLSDNGSNISLAINKFEANHIMIAFGYSTINYYNSSNSLIRTYTYIYVASGSQLYTGVYILNINGMINDAEAAYIY